MLLQLNIVLFDRTGDKILRITTYGLFPLPDSSSDLDSVSDSKPYGYIVLLPPTIKLGQGNIFTGVCDSVHRGGLPQCMLGYHTPGPGRHPPPQWSRAYWEIRSISGWYASYWNAILCSTCFHWLRFRFWSLSHILNSTGSVSESKSESESGSGNKPLMLLQLNIVLFDCRGDKILRITT